VLDLPCLLQWIDDVKWIDGFKAQGYAIVFVAKFLGRAT
jgi:hypothetical protein